jgi:hypothetical protein
VVVVLLTLQEGETADSQTGYVTDLRTALIDDNSGFVNVVVCESGYRALIRGIENAVPRVR